VHIGFSHPVSVHVEYMTRCWRGLARIDVDCIQLAEHGQGSKCSNRLLERGMPLTSGQLVHILVPKLRQVPLSELADSWNTRSSPRRPSARPTNPLRLPHHSNSNTA